MDESLAEAKGVSGLFLTFDDCAALFPRLKECEYLLSSEERKILIKIEKLLYGSLSILEVEELLEKASSKPASGGKRGV